MKRCVIYAFYDKDGHVDTYVFNMLDELLGVSERVVFVANGELKEKHHRELLRRGIRVIKRENRGFDIWAYRIGMLYLGWEALGSYDEVALVNNSVMGPVYPLQEVFSEMESREIDFWGLTRHALLHADYCVGRNGYGYLPEHIQSYFLVFRSSLLRAYEFQFYWEHLPEMNTYWDAVYGHEAVFTKYFADMGFSWDVFARTEEMDYLTKNPMMFYPRTLMEKYRCPVFKRRVFYHDYNELLDCSVGQQAMELYDYLDSVCHYDMSLIWENLLRTCNLNDLFKNMHLNYILPGAFSHREAMRKVLERKKAALIIHLYFADLLDDTWRYVTQLPDLCDVYITVNSDEMRKAVERKSADFPCGRLTIRQIPNRGRDVASILAGVKDIVGQYEYLCFCHDKKSTQVAGSIGEAFNYKCFENTLYSEDFIYNVIETFEKNPRLGVLCPPEPNHADYFSAIGLSWGQNENYTLTKKLAVEMGICVPIDRKKDAIAPFGSFFWFRYEALKGFYERGWEYDDFPEEPLPPDGTISHAIERLRPFVAQQAGYYTAYVMSERYARIEYTNPRTALEDFNKACFENGYVALHRQMVKKVGELISEKFAKEEGDSRNAS